jgi:hypothetical protein
MGIHLLSYIDNIHLVKELDTSRHHKAGTAMRTWNMLPRTGKHKAMSLDAEDFSLNTMIHYKFLNPYF